MAEVAVDGCWHATRNEHPALGVARQRGHSRTSSPIGRNWATAAFGPVGDVHR